MMQLEYRQYAAVQRRFRHPLVLLHGAWHGAWCWETAAALCAEHGWDVHVLSLRGHGNSDRPRLFNLYGLDHYVRDLHILVQTLTPRPIVVGHSMGGFIVQHYLQQNRLPGAVLLAPIPVTGAEGFLVRYLRHHPLRGLIALLRLNGKYLVDHPDLVRGYFLGARAEAATVRWVQDRLAPEPLRMIIDTAVRVPRAAVNRSPVAVIAAENDRVFTLDEQHATAAAYGVPCHVIPGGAHDLMLDGSWPQVVKLLEQHAQVWERGIADERF